jgi:hypothetical protein
MNGKGEDKKEEWYHKNGSLLKKRWCAQHRKQVSKENKRAANPAKEYLT